MWTRTPLVLVLTLILGACATHKPAVMLPFKLDGLSTWQVQGRLGIRSPGANSNLSFVWQETPDGFELAFRGALGVSVATMSGDTSGVVLTLADGRRFESDNVDNLLDRELGYPFPVSHLRYWVRGIPDPGLKYASGTNGFRQQGWLVEYLDHDELGPKKLTIERYGTRLKLAALKWTYAR